MIKLNYIRQFLLMAIMFWSSIFFTNAQQPFSLQQAIDYGVKSNVNKINSDLNVTEAKKKIWETTTIGLPRIEGEIGYQNFIDIPTTVVPANFFGGPAGEIKELQFGTPHNANAKVTASQLVFDGSYIVGLKASKVYLELAQKQVQQSETEIKVNVAKAYYTVLVAEDNKKILAKSVENLKKIHFETNELFKNGFVEEIDVDRLSLSLSNLQTQLQNIERQTQLAYKLLKFQMGMEMKEEIVLTDSIGEMFASLPSEITAEIGFQNRVEYKLMQTQTALMKLNMKRYQMGYLPSIAAFYSHQQNAQRNKFNFFDSNEKWYPTSIFGVQIKIPIFNSFGKTSVVQQAKLEWLKAQNQQKNLEQALTLEGEKVRTNYTNAFAQFENQKKNLALSEKIYKVTLTKYKEGVGSSMEVSQAESQFFQTQSAYINALYELLVMKVELDKAMGN